ncbi:MAG: UrcA family protein [Terriglobales bacterium]
MNTMTTAKHPSRLIAAVIFSALASSFAAVCGAANSPEAPSVIVKFGDLNISNPEGAAALYSRIRDAARGLCSPLDRGDLASKMDEDICVNQAIEDAVTRVDQPALSAVYAAKFRAMHPVELLAARKH